MWPVSRTIDRYDTTFDHDGLIANAGLIVTATLMSRLGLERLANTWVRTGSFEPGRKICTLIAAMVAGATHIDHVDVLRAGATQSVLGFKCDGTLDGRHVPAYVHVRVRPSTRRRRRPTCWRTRGLGVPVPATPIMVIDSGFDDLRSARPRQARRRIRLHQTVSATTRSSPPAPTPVRFCSRGCAKDQPGSSAGDQPVHRRTRRHLETSRRRPERPVCAR